MSSMAHDVGVVHHPDVSGCGRLGSLPRSLCSMNWQTPTPLHVLEISWRPSVPVFLRRAYRTLLIRSLWCSDDTMLWKTAPKLRFRSDQPCAYSSLCAFESELRPHQPGADDWGSMIDLLPITAGPVADWLKYYYWNYCIVADKYCVCLLTVAILTKSERPTEDRDYINVCVCSYNLDRTRSRRFVCCCCGGSINLRRNCCIPWIHRVWFLAFRCTYFETCGCGKI